MMELLELKAKRVITLTGYILSYWAKVDLLPLQKIFIRIILSTPPPKA